MILRPMLCAKLKDTAKLQYPVLASHKFDGVRALVVLGRAVTRAFKPVPNRYVADLLASLPNGLDGELTAEGDFSATQSGIMSYHGQPAFTYNVFDWMAGDNTEPYYARLARLRITKWPSFVSIVEQTKMHNEDELLTYEANCLALGLEGIIVRSAHAPYKFGRSTAREGFMFKLKRFEDSEAIVIGLEEACENTNTVVPNAFGLSKRPGGRGGKVPKATLGSFQVRDVHTGVEFSIGTGKGLTAQLRQAIWDNPGAYIGAILRYRFQQCGVKDKPRFPSFQGWRHADDM